VKRLNYATTFLTEALVIGSYLLAFRLVAGYAGTEGFGEYSLSRRTLSLLAPLAVLGADLGLARYASYAEAEKSGKSSSFAAAALLLLAAGVAHEINTPVQFVSDNVKFVRTSMSDIGTVIRAYRDLQHAVQSQGDVAGAAQCAAAAETAADLDYLIENAPLAVDSVPRT